MEQQVLVEGEPEAVVEERRARQQAERAAAVAQQPARLRRPERAQVSCQIAALEDLLPATHRARAVWGFVERLDLRALEAGIRARRGGRGRPALDPRVGLALWLYATSQGVGSARRLAELCQYHDAYRWLCGGVSVNYHTLSDFRTRAGHGLDELLTQTLGVLLHQQLLTLRRVVQDGTKIAAPVSRNSARRRATLEECLRQARAQLQAVRSAAAIGEQSAQPRRRQAAQERAARARQERVEAALKELTQLESERAAYKRGAKEPHSAPRASTSDPTARKMRMGDGGYRLGYNVQVASTLEGPQVVVGVAVTQGRTDFGTVAPMLEAIQERTGTLPEAAVVDAGYTSRKEIDAVAARGVAYGPLPERKGKGDPYAPQRQDSAAMRALKQRMQSAEGQQIYAQRAPRGELVNADCKQWRTLKQVTVRGLPKVTGVVLLNLLTFNMLRMIPLLGL